MRGPGIDIGPASEGAARDGEPAAGADERRCEIAGALIARAIPAEPPAAPWLATTTTTPTTTRAARPPSWDALRAALAGDARRWPGRDARRGYGLLVPALAGVAAVAVAMAAARGPAVSYEIEGGRVTASGAVEAAAGRIATVRFSDGTAIALAGGSAGRITERAPEGATFTLDRGGASFDVVHRPRARWRVDAGPFQILVTGTRFDVGWSGDSARAFEVDLHAGSVIVRGALAGAGVPLHAGQRLVARLDRDSLEVVDGDSAEQPSAAAPPAVSPPLVASPASPAAAAAPMPEPLGGAPPPGADRRRARHDRDGADQVIDVEPDSPPPPAPRVFPGGAVGWTRRSGMFMSTELAAGGAACLDWAPQVRFDQTIGGSYATSITALALSHAAQDHTRSWCGAGSLRADATFDVLGVPNHIKVRPHEVGSVVVRLGAPMDFTGKTISAHIYVEASSPDVVFAAQLFVIDGRNTWVGGGYLPNLSSGRWLTIVSRAYEAQNALFEGGTSPVDAADSLAIQIYAEGKLRAWTGKVFVDDLGWK